MAEILDVVKNADSALGCSELARRTGLPKSTVWRLCTEMAEAGFVDRYGDKVGIGLRVFEWGVSAHCPELTREVAMPLLLDLHAATGHTVHLAVLDGLDVVYLEILPGRNTPRLPSRVGGRLPAHATGVGKALLAASPADVVDSLLDTRLTALGPRTVRHPDLLRRQLMRAATGEVALEWEESGPGIGCMAAAVRDVNGVAVAAISAAGWAGRMNQRYVGSAVQGAARDLSRALRPVSTRATFRRD
ncbi:IclR family transcriptional regulator [Mycolicibacterium sp. BiH015]|uniref:IclR family transcriptional regulator n=1 Tax=Mycolicibacterium sp. BiH015 TaxID=3018808 RepID=UPI0022E2137C|nr:IclR family transcriptional regulator [Mycolicibacterium sp. BiH015]MDA2893242.1 IclR family transcriptional regulator [Mycolicibacterium sp. BiH015]